MKDIFNRHAALVLWSLFAFFSVLIFFLHYNFVTSFSFVDEYTHFVAADYMLQGEILYQDIFFQHQPLPVYLSFALQYLLHPDTLYKLVLEHRLFVFAFSLFFDFLIILRFRFVGLGFVFVYELTKYYLFGNLFLGEAFVAQPLAYLLGLLWEKLQEKGLSVFDILLSGLLTWFIIFMREPLAPAALLLFIVILFGKDKYKAKIFSIILVLGLSMLTVFTLPVGSYITDLVILNFSGYIQQEIATNNLVYLGFFYPLLILFIGEWNEFRTVLLFLDIFFFVFVALYLLENKKKNIAVYKSRFISVLLFLVVLGLCAIRVSGPGNLFYSGFHLLPWYALFIMVVFLLLREIPFQKKRFIDKRLVAFFIIGCIVTIIFLYPHSYMTQQFDRETLFTTNYGRFYTIGSVMKILGEKESTVFVDHWDSLVYWEAGLPSAYQYVFSYPVMGTLAEFTQARTAMFTKGPPDFYYIDCGKDVYSVTFASKEIMALYTQLHMNGKPSCFYIKTSLLSIISEEQWKQAAALGARK